MYKKHIKQKAENTQREGKRVWKRKRIGWHMQMWDQNQKRTKRNVWRMGKAATATKAIQTKKTCAHTPARTKQIRMIHTNEIEMKQQSECKTLTECNLDNAWREIAWNFYQWEKVFFRFSSFFLFCCCYFFTRPPLRQNTHTHIWLLPFPLFLSHTPRTQTHAHIHSWNLKTSNAGFGNVFTKSSSKSTWQRQREWGSEWMREGWAAGSIDNVLYHFYTCKGVNYSGERTVR